jgi:hypothetical protein
MKQLSWVVAAAAELAIATPVLAQAPVNTPPPASAIPLGEYSVPLPPPLASAIPLGEYSVPLPQSTTQADPPPPPGGSPRLRMPEGGPSIAD